MGIGLLNLAQLDIYNTCYIEDNSRSSYIAFAGLKGKIHVIDFKYGDRDGSPIDYQVYNESSNSFQNITSICYSLMTLPAPEKEYKLVTAKNILMAASNTGEFFIYNLSIYHIPLATKQQDSSQIINHFRWQQTKLSQDITAKAILTLFRLHVQGTFITIIINNEIQLFELIPRIQVTKEVN